MSLKNFAKGLSAVLACLMTVSFLLSPADLRIDAHEAGTDSENTVIEVSDTSTETTDVLNEEEKVTAHDMTVQVNAIAEIEKCLEKIDYNESAVSIQFEKSEPSFESGVPGTYKVTYTVTPHSGKPSYSVTRDIEVISSETGSDAEDAAGSGDEETSEDETDPLPDKEEETVADKDSEEKTDKNTEDKNDKDSEEKEDEKSEVKSEGETVSEKESDDSEEVKGTENSSENVQVKSVTGNKRNVTITGDETFIYYDHKMSSGSTTFFTKRYKIVDNETKAKYYSYCSQPSKKGPIGNGFPGTGEFITLDQSNNSKHQLIARILYYGADALEPENSPAGDDSYFAQTSYGGLEPAPAELTREQKFIVTHMALGKVNDEDGWATNANDTAINHANALYQYALDRPIAIPTNASVPSLNLIADSKEEYGINENEVPVVKSKEYMFDAYPLYSITTTLRNGMYVEVENTPKIQPVQKGNKVTIYGGTKFRLVAPDKQEKNPISESFSLSGDYANYSMFQFNPDKSQNGTSFQDLVMLFAKGSVQKFEAEISVNWLQSSKISIAKVDLYGNKISGAKLQLIDSDNNVIEWVSGTKEQVFTSAKLVPGEKYILKEVEAPAGYVLSPNTVEVTMPLRGTNEIHLNSYEFKNAKYSLQFLKVNSQDSPISGAELAITDESGTVIEIDGKPLEWTSGETPHEIVGLKEGETYYLTETKAPDRYTLADPVEFTVDLSEAEKDSGIQLVKMTDEKTKVTIRKVAKDSNGNEITLTNAWLQIFTKDGEPVGDRFLSGESVVKTGLAHGTYELREVETPAGYVTAEPAEFIINQNSKNEEVVMVDEKTKVQISKKDITNGEELPGAELTILDEEGKVELLSWTSSETPHVIEGLPVGTYTLREVTAPAGYVKHTDIKFTVSDDAKVQQVEMKDEVTRIQVQKISKRTGDPIKGATLSIRDKDGNVVKEGRIVNGKNEVDLNVDLNKDGVIEDGLIFKSGNEPIEITHLPYGEYWLHEDVVPAGYVKAKPVKFVLKAEDFENDDEQNPANDEQNPADDEQNPAGDEQNPAEKEPFILLVTMEDDSIKVQFSKRDITTQEELPGATLSILNSDGTYYLDENKDRVSWISTNEPHLINELPAGEYILREEIAPEGYLIANDVKFTVKETGDIQTVVMEDDYTKVDIIKIDDMDEPVIGALLRLETEDGKLIKEFTSGEEAVRFDRLPVGKYVLTELEAPEGYDMAEPIVFEVKAEAGVQTVTMIDEILIETGGEEEPEPENPGKPSNPEQPDNPKPSTPAPSAPNTSKTSPATATETGWMTWIVLAAAAFILLIVLTVLRKKTEKN